MLISLCIFKFDWEFSFISTGWSFLNCQFTFRILFSSFYKTWNRFLISTWNSTMVPLILLGHFFLCERHFVSVVKFDYHSVIANYINFYIYIFNGTGFVSKYEPHFISLSPFGFFSVYSQSLCFWKNVFIIVILCLTNISVVFLSYSKFHYTKFPLLFILLHLSHP